MEVIACFRKGDEDATSSGRRKLETFAKEHGFAIKESVVIDAFHSPGEDLWAREWLVRVLILSLTTQRKSLLLQDWSLLASSDLEIVILHQQLTDLGFQVATVEGPLPNVSQSAKKAVSLSVAAGTSLEKARTAAVLQIGRRSAMRRNGRCGGNPRYGTLPGEQLILERIAAFYRTDKLSYSAISKRLNEEGVRPRQAASWTPTTIASLLGARRAKLARKKIKSPPSRET